MKITDYIDQCIANFANLIDAGEGWIAKDDVLRQFTTRFKGFESPIFDKEELKKYIINDLKDWYGIEARDKKGSKYMESKEYSTADAFNKIYAILEELNAEIENLPGNVKTVPLFRKIDKIYDCLQYLKFSDLNFKNNIKEMKNV